MNLSPKHLAFGFGLVVALGCGGAPGGDVASPAPQAVAGPSLEFTRWRMEFQVGEGDYYQIDFVGDGTWMSDGDGGGHTWRVEGDRILMSEPEITYDAKFVDGYTIGGMVTQKSDGRTWPFRMTRKN